ncbi:hypothetical protein ACP70R_025076 [Stipagrostis hirtigluma subsp. patula]
MRISPFHATPSIPLLNLRFLARLIHNRTDGTVFVFANDHAVVFDPYNRAPLRRLPVVPSGAPYCGYHPSVSRRPMPEPGTEEYRMLESDPEKVFIRTITCQFQALVGVSLLEILSSHSSDEIYLGQRDTPAWTSDARAQEAFKRFGARLTEIEKRVVAMNKWRRRRRRDERRRWEQAAAAAAAGTSCGGGGPKRLLRRQTARD